MKEPCVFCASIQSTLEYHCSDQYGDNYEVRKCSDCSCVYLSPHPTSEQLSNAYDDSYYGEGEEKFDGFLERWLRSIKVKKARTIARMLPTKGRVLDLGCGNGYFLEAMAIEGFESYGVEPGKAAHLRAAKLNGLTIKLGVLEDSDFEKDFFDVVTMFHVFEHLPNPAETLECISKILKPGGLLIIAIPNIDSFQSKWFKGDWLHLDPPRHLFFFGRQALSQALSSKGFSISKIKNFHPEYNPFGFQQSALNKWSTKRELLYEELKGNTAYTKGFGFFPKLLSLGWIAVSLPFLLVFDLVLSPFNRSGTIEYWIRKEL